MTQAHKVKSGYCFVLLVSCVMLMQPAFAQLKVYPLPGPAGSVKKTKTKSSVARTQELLPRSLPFWDDFSWTNTAGLKDSADYPVDSLWVNNYTVLNPGAVGVHKKLGASIVVRVQAYFKGTSYGSLPPDVKPVLYEKCFNKWYTDKFI